MPILYRTPGEKRPAFQGSGISLKDPGEVNEMSTSEVLWDLGAADKALISTGVKRSSEFILEVGLKDEHIEF